MTGNTAFDVKIASTGATITVGAEQTIVEALEDADIEVTVSCEQGICGTCVTAVVSGEPDHRDSYFTDEEHASNELMTICCSRAKTALLELDL